MFDFIRNLFGTSKASRPRAQFQPELESLEHRTMMAGDVAAYLSGNTLYIEGDGRDNQIEIYRESDNSVRILGDGAHLETNTPLLRFDGGSSSVIESPENGFPDTRIPLSHYYTMINGGYSETITGSFDSIQISTYDGSDSVEVHDINLANDLRVDLGDDADELDIYSVTTGDDMTLWTGGGGTTYERDTIAITNTQVGSGSGNHDLIVTGSSDVERVSLLNVTVADDMYLYLAAGSEEDHASLIGGNRVLGDYYGGTARIDAHTIEIDDLEVDGGGYLYKTQALQVSSSSFDTNLYVTGTPRDDVMEFTDVSAGNRPKVRAYDGDDIVTVMGSTGFEIDGGDDDDVLTGGSGADKLLGGNGLDTLRSGAGEDELYGGAHRDRLFGGSHRDKLFGGSGEDFLDGGSGNDDLFGESGRDALYGGIGDDTLDGGSSADRFLILRDHENGAGLYGDDIVEDKSSADVEIFFEDFDQTTIPLNGLNVTTYEAGQWTDQNIQWVDDAFRVMVERTQNNGLIGDGLVLGRVGTNSTGNNFSAFNSLGLTVYSDAAFTSRNGLMQTVFHETAHNWDNENPYWGDFMNISGWTQYVGRFDPTPYTLARDFQWVTNQWWYKTDEADTFARSYGKTNPMEDFAPSFALYMMDWGAANTEYTFLNYGGSPGDVSAKMDLIDKWLDEV